MASQRIGIEEARKQLGDLVTAAAQGTDIVLTRNGRPVAHLQRYEEPRDVTLQDVAAGVGQPSAVEHIARFIGCFEIHDPRTGRLAKPWSGQGLNARFTRAEADQIAIEWDHYNVMREQDEIDDIAPLTAAPIEQMPGYRLGGDLNDGR